MRKLKLEELGRVSLAQYKSAEKQPIVLVLDNIRSGLNVGSIFRTADAFAIQEVFLCGITAQPPHREVLKSAIGATDAVPWQHQSNILEVVQQLRSTQHQICGVEQTSESVPLHQFTGFSDKIALILGNEVTGISNEILPHLDLALEIPQYGTKHSLNVAVCAGIVMWHLTAQKLN